MLAVTVQRFSTLGSLVFVLVFVLQEHVQAQPIPISATNMDFSNWNEVLKQIVHEGTKKSIHLNLVNFSGLKGNKHYEAFTKQVEDANVTGFNQNQFTAFWINVYNYLAVRIVYENPCAIDLFGNCKPLRSIRQVGEQQPSFFLDTVWKMPYLNIKSVANVSLDDIEHHYLRTPYLHGHLDWKEDPRALFCLASSSISGPDLRRNAFEAATIDRDMKDATEAYLKNPDKGSAVESGRVKLSLLFNWFEDDFFNSTGPKKGNSTSVSLPWFLIQYAPDDVKREVKKNEKMTFLYFSYNWDLNGDVDTLCGANRVCFPAWALIATIIGSIILLVTIVLCVRMNKPKGGYKVVN